MKMLICLLTTTLVCSSALAGELIVHGTVTGVEPIAERTYRSVQTGDCNPTKPSSGGDLMSLMAWDLRLDCHTKQVTDEVIRGYRVNYEWDDRQWQTVTQERPGSTIALRIEVN